MNRQQQLQWCQKCKHRKMNMQRGLLCGLTDEFANFETECKDFDKDVVRDQEIRLKQEKLGLTIDEVTAKPGKLWSKFIWIFLIFVAILLVKVAVYSMLYSGTREAVGFMDYFWLILLYFPFWPLVGWELNKLKEGLIAGGITFGFGFLVELFPDLRLYFIPTLAFIFGAIYFAIATLDDRSAKVKFSLYTLIIYFGIGCTGFWNELELSREVGQILGLLFDSGSFFRSGFFTVSMEFGGELSIDWLIGNSIGRIAFFLGVTYLYRYAKGEWSWKPNRIELGRSIKPQEMAIYVFVFFSAIGVLALGLFGRVFYFFRYLNNEFFWMDNELRYDIYINTVLGFFSGLALLLALVVFYRKLLVEYYLNHKKRLGWNYYFGQVPLIGIFVWLNNLLTWKQAKTPNKHEIKALSKPGQSLIGVLVVIAILYGIGMISISRGEAGIVIPVLVTIGIYIMYWYNSSGVYFLVGLQLIIFFVIVALEFMEVYIPEGAVSKTLFWSISQAILLYPAFHMSAFRVTVPEAAVSHEETEIF